jgi:hypothetical protein
MAMLPPIAEGPGGVVKFATNSAPISFFLRRGTLARAEAAPGVAPWGRGLEIERFSAAQVIAFCNV